MKNTHVEDLRFGPIDLPTTGPFAAATGTRNDAESVLVRVTLSDGTHGYGEAAPFPEVGTEDRESCLQALAALTPSLLDRAIHDYQALAPHLAEQAGSQLAARCSLKIALLGAYCRATAISLWQC